MFIFLRFFLRMRFSAGFAGHSSCLLCVMQGLAFLECVLIGAMQTMGKNPPSRSKGPGYG